MAAQLRPCHLVGLHEFASFRVRRERQTLQRCQKRASTLCALSTQAQDQGSRTVGVSWGCDVYSVDSANACQEWLAQEGLPPPKVVVKKVDTGGRGMVSVDKIRRGELVISVPSSTIMSINSKWSLPEAGEILHREGVPEWPTLATFLVSEACQGKSSRWRYYIDSLPQQPNSILQWSRAEVNKYLAASPTKERAIECISGVTDVYALIQLVSPVWLVALLTMQVDQYATADGFESLNAKVFSKHPELFPPEVFELENFKWAFGILFSRAVRLPTLGKVALVPLADMFNHSTEAETFLDFVPSSLAVTLAAGRAYEQGQQVFNSYGKRSSSELLIAYGFVPLEVNNEDSVELVLSLNSEDEMYEAKAAALKEHGLTTPQRYPVRKDGLPAQLLAFAHLVACPPDMESLYKEIALAATYAASKKQEDAYLSHLALDIDIQAYEIVLAICESAISRYSTFLKGKEKLADNSVDETLASSPDSRVQWLTGNAVLLCTNERRVLYRLQSALRNKLRELRAAVSEGAELDKPYKGPGFLGGLKKLFTKY